MNMRIWLIAGVSIVVGIVAGWAWTAAELGASPSGGDRVEWGWPESAAAPAPAAPAKAPKVSVDQKNFNFGHLELGGVGRHEFVFKNEGHGPLVLSKGETSCVCTVAEIAHPTVAPGASTSVEVEWHPKARGQFRQSVQVLTNDPRQPKIELVVYGDIVSSYSLEPQTIVFSGVPANRGTTADTRIYSYDTDNLEILNPELADKANTKYFTVAVEKLTPSELKQEKGAKSGCRLIVTVKPGLPAGPFGERIRFHLNIAGDPQLELALQGNIVGPIDVWGPNWDDEHKMVSFGTVRSREGAKAQLFLTVRSDALKQANFRVTKVVPKTLKVTLGKMQSIGPNVGRVPLTIEIPPGSPPDDHLGTQIGPLAKIMLDTGLAENEQMRILVRYAVAGQ
jgi:hypothetical protein